ncbi:hypothetical protein INS49_003983 [Diaporthe citri]|uniref:uncharacterized protein n=1 Tax=Diaporthe citri TaxID=83186 RepID=UPI001C7E9375|nr:uncharacterized protein INS49_003983 [Diaporthe citri]KAG6354902.1 hypothetical protein INS49_003983 [Diaporthe citri]
MARSLRSNKKKGDLSQVPTEAPDVADGAVPGATASDAPVSPSGTASATEITPEGFPKCQYCFRSQSRCDGNRPCATCPRNRRRCHDVTQETLNAFPERAKRVLRKYELQKSTARNRTKRPAAAASATDITPEGYPRCGPCFTNPCKCDGERPCDSCSKFKRRCRDVTQQELDANPKRAERQLREHERQKKRAASIARQEDEPSAKKKQKVASSHCSSSD